MENTETFVIVRLPGDALRFAKFPDRSSANAGFIEKPEIFTTPEDLLSLNLDTLRIWHRKLANDASTELPPMFKEKKRCYKTVWNEICAKAQDRSQTIVRSSKGLGKRAAFSEKSDGIKFLTSPADDAKLPRQVKVCIDLVKKLCNKTGATSEVLLKAAVYEAAKLGTLKTKQDPWRIFKYYQPLMITNKLIAINL